MDICLNTILNKICCCCNTDSECSLQSVKDSRSELESRVLELQTLVKEQEADVAVERSKNAELDRRHSQLVSLIVVHENVAAVFWIDRK